MNTLNEHYLAELKTFFADAHLCRDCAQLVEQLSIRLAALGEADQVLAIVKQSLHAELFVSLTKGLEIHLGHLMDDNEAAREIADQIQTAHAEYVFSHVASAA